MNYSFKRKKQVEDLKMNLWGEIWYLMSCLAHFLSGYNPWLGQQTKKLGGFSCLLYCKTTTLYIHQNSIYPILRRSDCKLHACMRHL